VDLHVSLEGRGDLTARIYRQLLDAILDGRLRSGERLPPSRELARRLDVARNTVAVAYERLTAEGFLTARVGDGTYVSDEAPVATRPRRAPRGSHVRPRRIWDSVPVDLEKPSSAYNFNVGVPDVGLFPLEAWRRLVARELRYATIGSGQYRDPAGHAPLRSAIARYAGVARSVRAGAEDVIVTQGAQQAIDLIGRVIVEPGDLVAVEEPGYPPARQVFQTLGARVVGVPVDAEGLDVSAIPTGVRLVYTTPSHQFPTGVPMSLARRTALLDWARSAGALIIEDDYDSEFRYSTRPLEPLQGLDRDGRVVYVGTFSKTLLPLLRTGYAIAPASLQPALLSAKWLADRHGETFTQAALARLMEEGLLARHVRKASRVYAERHELVLTILRRDFADWLEVVPASAGLHICTHLRPDVTVDLEAVVDRAAESGVTVESLARYCGARPRQAGLVLGYGGIATERVGPGLKRLRSAFEREPARATGLSRSSGR
jgi:GntR family transcriptional regulator / MocR family aminotransferase